MATSARALHERLHFNQKVARGQPEATAALIDEVDVSPVAVGSGTRVFGAVNGLHLVDNPSDVTQGGRLNAEAVRGSRPVIAGLTRNLIRNHAVERTRDPGVRRDDVSRWPSLSRPRTPSKRSVEAERGRPCQGLVGRLRTVRR